jgi:hypothetical protein
MAKVVLPDGKNVDISSVLLNKEQNINVSKTYVTTVKKAVTKVSGDFYKVTDDKKEEPASQLFEAMKDNVFETPVVTEQPVLETNVSIKTVVPELTKVEPILPTMSVENINQDNNKAVDNIKLDIPTVQNVIKPEIKSPIADVPAASNAPITNENLENVQAINNNNPEASVVQNESAILPVTNVVEPEVKPILEPITPSIQQPIEIPKIEPILPAEPIQSVESTASTAPVVSSESISKVDNSTPKLFFDGSKETNLNMALGEVSEEKTMTTESEGVQALRQFGSDQPVLPPQETVLPAQKDVKILTRSKGFANNKFFMVIAIAFFVAACVFLGYEAFQYFQIAG